MQRRRARPRFSIATTMVGLAALPLIAGSLASGLIALASLSEHSHQVAVTSCAGGFDLVLEHEGDAHHEPGAVELHGPSCDPTAHEICLARSGDPQLVGTAPNAFQPHPVAAIDSSLGCRFTGIAALPGATSAGTSSFRQRSSVVLRI